MVLAFKGRSLVGGKAEGKTLVTRQAFMFPHGIDPKTGRITDVRHELYGSSIKGKVFIFPFGKGSTTGSTWILETIRCGNGPVAIVNLETEPIIATGVILGEMLYGVRIPVIDRVEKRLFNEVRSGDRAKIDGDTGSIEVMKPSK